jgi:hypothetical protein
MDSKMFFHIATPGLSAWLVGDSGRYRNSMYADHLFRLLGLSRESSRRFSRGAKARKDLLTPIGHSQLLLGGSNILTAAALSVRIRCHQQSMSNLPSLNTSST